MRHAVVTRDPLIVAFPQSVKATWRGGGSASRGGATLAKLATLDVDPEMMQGGRFMKNFQLC
jgi:hypothetical protein